MIPKLHAIDHVHVYVADRDAAEHWYQSILGFRRVEKFMVWATNTGPLTIENDSGDIHLALFQRTDCDGDSTLAFGVSGDEFLDWKTHLEGAGLKLRLTDHDLMYSLYFSDPWNNLLEITTGDRDFVAEHFG